jgi:disulfide oxidoreductase YuzD
LCELFIFYNDIKRDLRGGRMNKDFLVEVFGAEVICASCVGMPSSIETFEWLQAALSRKFPEKKFNFQYIDIFRVENPEKEEFAERVRNDEFFYPVVLVDGEVVGEGNPKLKDVYAAIEKN